MDIKQLQYFVTIADEGSITAAARKLYMSQPPLSSQMKLLENELNCILFERGARSIHLTDAGQTLYQYAKSILDLSAVAKEETEIAAKKHNDTLRIGIVSSVICSNALEWLRSFSQKYPEIDFELIEGNTYELIHKFQSNLIHLAVLRTPFSKENLTCERIFTDELVAIGMSDFFDKNESECTLSELSPHPLITYRRWETILKSQFETRQIPVHFSCVNDDVRTTLYFVESGLGIGIVPLSAVSRITEKNVLCKKIKDCTITSDVVLAYNTDIYLPECSKNFIHFIQNLYCSVDSSDIDYREV